MSILPCSSQLQHMETILIILLIFSVVLILLSIEYFFNTSWICPFLWILAELISLMGTFFLMEDHVSPIFGMHSTLPNPEYNQLSSTYPYFSTEPIPSDANSPAQELQATGLGCFFGPTRACKSALAQSQLGLARAVRIPAKKSARDGHLKTS